MVDLEGQVSLFGPDTWSGKTSPELSVPKVAKTSQLSSKKSSKSQSREPICVCVCRRMDGQNPGVITLRMDRGALLGEYTMLSFGESPKEENVSRLSQILEDKAHPKYSLSAKACQGILNRAIRRGKELPEELKIALEQQASASTDTLNTIDRPAVLPINTMVGTRDTSETRTTFGIGEEDDPQFTISSAHEHAIALLNKHETGISS